MPWKTFSLLEARQRFVQTALRGVKSVAQLCAEAHISRKTGFKWLSRFRSGGPAALQNRSRRPKRSPRQTRPCWIKEILQWRTRHPSWGAKKIFARLRQKHPRAQLSLPNGSVAQAPNDVWTVDFKATFAPATLSGWIP